MILRPMSEEFGPDLEEKSEGAVHYAGRQGYSVPQ